MDNFPIEKLKFTHAKLSGTDGSLSIEIGIEPFELSQDEYTENVDTSIRLDCINLPKNVSHLTGQSFCFPVNPEEGYIDGSIYFFAAHNPVDVTEIKFGELLNGKLTLLLETSWDLEFERTGFKNFNKTIQTYIAL